MRKLKLLKLNKIRETTPLLPTECMQQILKYVDDQENGLYSCLLVNKYWCKNVLPLLWASPFQSSFIISHWVLATSSLKSTLSKKAINQLNNYKIIDTYISCLDNKEFYYLNSLFQKFYSINLKIGKKPLINYSNFLQELLYSEFENTIYIYLMRKFKDKYKEQQILVMATSLLKLFLKESTNLRIINFNKKFHNLDTPNLLPKIMMTKNFLFTNNLNNMTEILSLNRLVKFQINNINSKLTQNTINLLKLISINCKNIHYLDFKFKHFEYNDNILQLIISIIKSQDHISEFNISQIKDNFELILLNLLLLHKNTLISMKLDNVYISENSKEMLKQFFNIRKIKLLQCNKLTSEVLPDYTEQLEQLKMFGYKSGTKH
ncbi:unnamed protein product [Rhizophagus irregularis]|uniref:F-box domain-containing protein n=1 Tax=Rhizophagus irregularis TaxID=588596 RepID=A0A2I1FSM7_9GLOM|nr:hypothetical protein RhiirA4_450223 [Rhizophagus irregularis]CAB4424416.1 unnamed protein product [Rhizophagus irregularis]